MPMDVTIRLLTPKTEHIYAFTGHDGVERLRDLVNNILKPQVGRAVEISMNALNMTFRSNERVAVHRRVPTKKGQVLSVVVHNLMLTARLAGHQRADETPAASSGSFVCREIHRDP